MKKKRIRIFLEILPKGFRGANSHEEAKIVEKIYVIPELEFFDFINERLYQSEIRA
jgi:hypothetical protein